jgi:ribosomal protein S12 methylthiotransferase accessory factor
MGITRVGDVTGLDRVGLPVVMVVRPNSRALSVSQGKGLTTEAAKASGIMESIETYHAERIEQPLRFASWRHLRARVPVADVDRLPLLRDGRFNSDLEIPWIEGDDLLQGQPVWVPFECVHTDFREPPPLWSGSFLASSNGLAAGNHSLEATCHGIAEVVERDAMTWWSLKEYGDQRETRLDLATVDDEACRGVAARLEAAGLLVAVWDMTNDVGVPAFACTILESEDEPLCPMVAASGHGCHPSRAIALVRALTEAAQARLTAITGSRDDLLPEVYARHRDPARLRAHRLAVAGPAARDLQTVPTFEGATFDEDRAFLLERLRHVGVEQVICVDLTQPRFGIPVVRIVIPGMECAGMFPERVAPGVRP